MNPALLAYMQQVQNMPHPANGTTAPSSPIPMDQPPVNPFSVGTMEAIKAAKASLGMDADERRRAMGLAMLHFGSNMANPNIGQGSPLGAVAQSILPAVQAYQGEENRVQDTNAALAQYIQQAQMQQQMMQYHALKERELMQHRQAELEERKRHHEEMADLKKLQLGGMTPYQRERLALEHEKLKGSQVPEIDESGHDLSSYAPLETKGTLTQFVKEKRNTGTTLHEINDIRKSLDEFKKITLNNKFDPASPYTSGIANKVKDLAAYYGNPKDESVKSLQKERDLRKRLSSKLDKFAISLERKLKGGVLSDTLIRRFENKNILPNMNEGLDVLENKLNDLEHEIKGIHDASTMSLKYKRHN
jgi:hypothetical protein